MGPSPLPALNLIVAVFLVAAVFAAVYHAEVIALRVGEPFGSLVLAVAATVIEVALIVTVTGGPAKTASLARNTVFAAVTITCNGVLGLALLVASLRRRIAVFNAEGTGAALATVATICTMSLVLPTFTTSRPGPQFSPAQVGFAAVSSLALYRPVASRPGADPDHAAGADRGRRRPHRGTRPGHRAAGVRALSLLAAYLFLAACP